MRVNTTMFFGLRINTDYRQPHGGFRPVKVTYRWKENDQPKEHVYVAHRIFWYSFDDSQIRISRQTEE